MRRSRASALLAALAIMLVTIVGAVLTPTAASANRGGGAQHYPPAPPALVVNRGVVWTGETVYAAGRQFQPGERVTVLIRLAPPGAGTYRVLRTSTVVASRPGTLYFGVRATNAGYLAITVTGQTSGKTATVVIYVAARGRGPRGW